MDVNGDGLPDRVTMGEDKKLYVSLNLGYGLPGAEVWNFDEETDKHLTLGRSASARAQARASAGVWA
jgi:hypothetical protein